MKVPEADVWFVLDSGAISHGANLEAQRCIIPSAVAAEFAPGGATRRRLEVLLAAGALEVDPSPQARTRVRDAARASGALMRLSPADVDVVAVALERGPGSRVVSDDLTVLDVAQRLAVTGQPISTRGITETIDWAARCVGCGRRWPLEATAKPCGVCGSEVRAKPRRTGHKV